jgi:hypothetical protein
MLHRQPRPDEIYVHEASPGTFVPPQRSISKSVVRSIRSIQYAEHSTTNDTAPLKGPTPTVRPVPRPLKRQAGSHIHDAIIESCKAGQMVAIALRARPKK